MRVPAQTCTTSAIEGGSTTAPLQVINNHIYVSVMLNGADPTLSSSTAAVTTS